MHATGEPFGNCLEAVHASACIADRICRDIDKTPAGVAGELPKEVVLGKGAVECSKLIFRDVAIGAHGCKHAFNQEAAWVGFVDTTAKHFS